MGYSLSSCVCVTNMSVSVGRTSKCCLMMGDWCAHILSIQGLGWCGLPGDRQNMWFPSFGGHGFDFL